MDLQARRIHTQTRVISRIVSGALLVAGLAFMLMTFPGARQLGASLLASAGVAGLVAGIAAKSVFSNLIAGLQIALSQPLRIDDVLIVKGEWGRVEEITGSYVVMRLWDQRRLIVPLQWFIENPFENWTRNRDQIGGSVFIDVDWETPVEEIRERVTKILEGSDLWDGRRDFVLVSNTVGATKQLQIGVSAANPENLFALQSLVREKITEFLLEHHPESVVRNRTESVAQPAPEREPDDENARERADEGISTARR